MDQIQPSVAAPKAPGRDMEKLLLILLFCITVFQFGGWGMQSVIYLLSLLFPVADLLTTPLDFIVGVIAMIGSALIFTGAALWWRLSTKAISFFTIGATLFIVKNIFDSFNMIALFSMEHSVYTVALIQGLAWDIGQQLFQLAFWVFILVFFRSKISERQ